MKMINKFNQKEIDKLVDLMKKHKTYLNNTRYH